jgi:hypothetical protein
MGILGRVRHLRRAALIAGLVLGGTTGAAVSGVAGNGNGNGGPPSAIWHSSVMATNAVVSSATRGGGYPVPPGATAPKPGTCGPGTFNANHSESALAVQPGTENLVGSSKFFFEKFSTFYDFYLGSYFIKNGSPVNNTIIQGYDCTTVGTQQMPPSWTNTTDPNLAFDSTGRVYQTMLPFNAFWANLHPDGAINVSFSDPPYTQWVTGNLGQPLEQSPNSSSFQFGHVEDKQWIAVNNIVGSPFQDHVYATWDIIDGNVGSTVKIRMAISRDRGRTFSKAFDIASASVDQARNQFTYPSIDAAGNVYVGFVNIGTKASTADLYVARSTDDGASFSIFKAGSATLLPSPLPNTTFRDGITENFAASPTYPGHLYMSYEDWDGTQSDVKFIQSTDFGKTWSAPVKVNDNVNEPTDQFQPSVAAGSGGAVAVGFYDRRAACPNDPSVILQNVGKLNFCINTTVQAYKDSGAGATPMGANIRASNATWDPQQPGLGFNSDGSHADLQRLGGLGQIACSSHVDPCRVSFIGDYFGLAISDGNIYTLSVSTHYQSGVVDDNGQPLYYQQQVLGTISRSSAGV